MIKYNFKKAVPVWEVGKEKELTGKSLVEKTSLKTF